MEEQNQQQNNRDWKAILALPSCIGEGILTCLHCRSPHQSVRHETKAP